MSQQEAQIMQRALCSTKYRRGHIDVVDVVDIVDIVMWHFVAEERVVLKRPCDGRPTRQELGV